MLMLEREANKLDGELIQKNRAVPFKTERISLEIEHIPLS